MFKLFYPKLVVTLPMNDAIFIATLYSQTLLPGDQVRKLDTNAEKAAHLLDHVIQPAITVSSNTSFYTLIEVMEYGQYSNSVLTGLAKEIRTRIKENDKSDAGTV